MQLPLDDSFRMGFMTGIGSRAQAREVAASAQRLGYDSIFTGDHVAFTLPILDPLLQLAMLGCYAEDLQLGTAVYLLPLRHPVLAAKQVASLDRLCEGRLIFGVGVGGEFAGEFEACSVPVGERGARLEAALPLMRSTPTLALVFLFLPNDGGSFIKGVGVLFSNYGGWGSF